MSDIDIKEILEQMKGKEVDTVYRGFIPPTIKKIIRMAYEISYCTEVVFKNLNEELLKQIAVNNGLVYEKKKQRTGFTCGCVANLFERMHELNNSTNTYTITKPRRLWSSAIIADVVNNTVRVYDTKRSIEIAAEVLEQYLEKESKKVGADTK